MRGFHPTPDRPVPLDSRLAFVAACVLLPIDLAGGSSLPAAGVWALAARRAA